MIFSFLHNLQRKALIRMPSTFFWSKDSVVSSKRLCRASVEKSIKDLNCQYLDLLLMHWPDAWCPGTQDPDENVTIEQTW